VFCPYTGALTAEMEREREGNKDWLKVHVVRDEKDVRMDGREGTQNSLF